MKIKRSFIALSIIAMIGVLAFTPKADDPLEKIIAALEKWATTNPQEKVYLHTDRPYYLVGDTIWLKAYVTLGAKHQLSLLSGAVYVDLINEKDSLTQSLKLPLSAGMANGDFILADSTMKDGNYRLRAYTQWMRNAGPDYFYDKVIKIGNAISNPVFASIKYEYAKDGKEATAIILYTDDKGEPYANKMINYELLANSNQILFGKKQTDTKGEVRVPLKPNTEGKYNDAYLVTKLEIQDKEIITKSFLIKSVSTQSDIQFFPESGTLVNGIRTKVAFKAIGTEGTGIAVKGIVTDNANATVAEFESSHLGMGFFQLMPEAGKTYQAKVTYPDGSESTIKLPVASDNGFVLSVYNNAESDTILVRVRTNEETLKKGEQSVGLVAQSGGMVYFGSQIPVNKTTVSIPIPAADFPSGIMQFTLFSAAGVPVNERIIFIQRNDQIDLKLSSAKASYGIRQKVDIDLDAKDNTGKALTGSFSVAVINETALPVDEVKENTIFSQLLLSSDIKGYVENPNYYFHNPNEETKGNLDILMLTQGYRRFVWKDLISGKPFDTSVKPEKLGTDITGKLLTLGNKPVAGGSVIMMSNKVAGKPIDTVTDAQGNFKFSNIIIPKGVGFSIQGRGPKNSNKVELKLNMPSSQIATSNPNIGDIENDTRKLMAAALENSRKQENDLLKRGMMGRTQQLKEVQIRARKRFGMSNTPGLFGIPDGHADQTVKPDQKDQFKDILEFLQFRLPNISFRMEDSGDCGMMMLPFYRNKQLVIYLNGRKLSPCENLSLYEGNPTDIVKVDVVSTNQALINLLGSEGLVITTKRSYLKTSNDFSLKSYSPQGYDSSKEFYSPKYKNDDSDPKVADLRSTIYWNPSVVSSGGKAKFNFFNADSKGTYRVVVEGLTPAGQIGRQVFRYKVE